MDSQMSNRHYFLFLGMTALHFFAMYILMYSMVDVFANIYNNVNQVYMAGLMTASMVIIEIALMSPMYHNRKANRMILAAGAIALLAFFVLIRQQAAVYDEQFLRSMIPHHSGAILMCEKASLRDPEIRRLCETIRFSQQSEIDRMKAKLAEIEKRK